jgi:pyruvate formate lyase activating enzyme
MKGCPLKCLWCANPESQNPHRELLYIEQNCIKCGRCLAACPIGAISPDFHIDRRICNLCGRCAEVCPSNAKKLSGREVTVSEVLEEIEKDRLFYRRSNGGVTIGGGEPTMQAEFVASVLRECHRLNLHTAIETSGFAKWDSLKRVLEHTDLVYFDIKHMNLNEHIKLTGASNEIILQNARRVADSKTPMIIRVPIIPGYNDSKDNMQSTARFIVDLGVKRVELLAYHRLGEHKYEWTGKEYQLKGLEPPIREHMIELEKTYVSNGINLESSR